MSYSCLVRPFAVIFLRFRTHILKLYVAEGALRAGVDANPPLNMHRALIFNGTIIMICAVSVLLLHGRQVRKERDEEKLQGFRGTHN